MRRAYKADDFRRLVERLAEAVPGIAVGTDIIVGFPGEGDTEFENTYRLLERLPIAYLHVFSYSPREGTIAAWLPDQVPKPVKAARSFALRSLSEKKWYEFRRGLVGKSLGAVVLDRRDPRSGVLEALSDNYVTITLDVAERVVGRMVDLTIETVTERGTRGRLHTDGSGVPTAPGNTG